MVILWMSSLFGNGATKATCKNLILWWDISGEYCIWLVNLRVVEWLLVLEMSSCVCGKCSRRGNRVLHRIWDDIYVIGFANHLRIEIGAVERYKNHAARASKPCLINLSSSLRLILLNSVSTGFFWSLKLSRSFISTFSFRDSLLWNSPPPRYFTILSSNYWCIHLSVLL